MASSCVPFPANKWMFFTKISCKFVFISLLIIAIGSIIHEVDTFKNLLTYNSPGIVQITPDQTKSMIEEGSSLRGKSNRREIAHHVADIKTESLRDDDFERVESFHHPLPMCDATPPNLEGPIPVIMEPLEWAELNKLFPEVEEGGRWRPKHCKSRHHMGIVIPYRDRDAHLRTYLRHMHKFWAKQELDYGIYVIEQDPVSLFNRGMLMNIGFVEALKVANYSCFIFSDVDLIPEDDRNIYGCPKQPRHLSVAIDTRGYKNSYAALFGGVENFRKEHFQKLNGFSNKFFGWGAEDDDLYKRLVKNKMHLTRPNTTIARYKALSHKHAKTGPFYNKYFHTTLKRMSWDGLNSLQYEIVQYEKRPLYTLISVVLNQTAVLQYGEGGKLGGKLVVGNL